MESISWARVLLAFTVVAALMALMGFVLKYIRNNGIALPGNLAPTRRLQIVESLSLDARRRLVIVRRDEAEHLLLLGTGESFVVEANLSKTAGVQTKSGA